MATAMDLFGKANEEFVSENYQRAIELYSEAIQAESDHDEFYVNRAQAFIKLDKFKEAIEDCSKAVSINPKNVKSFLRKGIALFHLKDYRNAIDAFREGKTLDASETSFQSWIDKCEVELPPLQSSSTSPSSQSASEAAIKMPSGAKTKYDWYQTATHVVVTVLVKNVQKEDFTADIQEYTLGVTIKQAGGADYSLELDLAHPIVPEQSTFKILTTKVEIKLKKAEGIRWTNLEGDGQQSSAKMYMAAPAAGETAPVQHAKRDWDKLAKEVAEEEKQEKKEGDAALNSLFQQIYSDGSEDVRRAMVKSFYESGGTVLSTNWSEVGKEKVEVKPPDGMEYKKYSS